MTSSPSSSASTHGSFVDALSRPPPRARRPARRRAAGRAGHDVARRSHRTHVRSRLEGGRDRAAGERRSRRLDSCHTSARLRLRRSGQPHRPRRERGAGRGACGGPELAAAGTARRSRGRTAHAYTDRLSRRGLQRRHEADGAREGCPIERGARQPCLARGAASDRRRARGGVHRRARHRADAHRVRARPSALGRRQRRRGRHTGVRGRLAAVSRVASERAKERLCHVPAGWNLRARSNEPPRPASGQGVYISPIFTSDGSSVVYAHGVENGVDLYTAPVSGGGGRRLSVGRGSDNVSPSFSPDGRRIAFMSGRAGHPEIYTMDADGTNVDLLTPLAFGENRYRASPDWSPDGRLVAFQSMVGGSFQILTINLRDRSMRQLTSDGRNEDPSWAPDGRHITFVSNRTGTRQLWVLDIESGRTRQLTRGAAVRLPAWSPRLGDE